ncbi:MAG: YlxR family protein [Oscillospiraceae bacterium]|nr:YlxR family protein [Oscillospiraceae bacterium]MBR3355062.1 YlxR family protein [Oscillospiraceae bacterium]
MPKKIPQRMCLGCREHKPKKELVRVVRSPEGEISVDLTGRKNGRGAYVCKSVECLKRARKIRSISKALDCEISDEVFEQLLVEIEEDNA